MIRTLELTGILQCRILLEKRDLQFEALFKQLPDEAEMVDELHITLAHQKIITPAQISNSEWRLIRPELSDRLPLVEFGTLVHAINRGKKRSWIVLLENQMEWRRFVNKCMTVLGLILNPEPYRIYHITLANLTGSPFDSVGDIDVSDFA